MTVTGRHWRNKETQTRKAYRKKNSSILNTISITTTTKHRWFIRLTIHSANIQWVEINSEQYSLHNLNCMTVAPCAFHFDVFQISSDVIRETFTHDFLFCVTQLTLVLVFNLKKEVNFVEYSIFELWLRIKISFVFLFLLFLSSLLMVLSLNRIKCLYSNNKRTLNRIEYSDF